MHQITITRLWPLVRRRGPPATPCAKCLGANGARRPQPAPNDHQIHCGVPPPALIRYKGKSEFHQKLRTTGDATNFCISNGDFAKSLDLLLIFQFCLVFCRRAFEVRCFGVSVYHIVIRVRGSLTEGSRLDGKFMELWTWASSIYRSNTQGDCFVVELVILTLNWWF